MNNYREIIIKNWIKLFLKDKNCLILGCGNGHDCSELEKYCKNIVGVDISSRLIKEAKYNFKNINFIQADAELLPFKNCSFDVVYCKSILHHLNFEKSIIELTRILRIEGILFIAYEPCLLNPFGFIGRKFFPSNIHTPNERPFIPYVFEKKITSNGYKKIYLDYFNLWSIIFPIIGKKLKLKYSLKIMIDISVKLENLIKITPLKNCYLVMAGIFVKRNFHE